jgi:hypothetical protein
MWSFTTTTSVYQTISSNETAYIEGQGFRSSDARSLMYAGSDGIVLSLELREETPVGVRPPWECHLSSWHELL